MEVVESYNLPHLARVMRARSDLGLFRRDCTLGVPHRMTGAKLVDRVTAEVVTVDRVLHHWQFGYYFALLVDGVALPWENQSSGDAGVIRRIGENKNRFIPLRAL